MALQASIDKLSASDFPRMAVGCLKRRRGQVGSECQVGNLVRLVTGANAGNAPPVEAFARQSRNRPWLA